MKLEILYLRPSSCPIPMLWPIMCAIVPANKCGSYTLISTLMPTAFGVQTVSGAAIPASPPANVSPLHFRFWSALFYWYGTDFQLCVNIHDGPTIQLVDRPVSQWIVVYRTCEKHKSVAIYENNTIGSERKIITHWIHKRKRWRRQSDKKKREKRGKKKEKQYNISIYVYKNLCLHKHFYCYWHVHLCAAQNGRNKSFVHLMFALCSCKMFRVSAHTLAIRICCYSAAAYMCMGKCSEIVWR